ncbi:hypothetical protein Rs2_20859 [Raphanus sativus]|uniref:L-aspartate oxidase, chloroplastic-like n=1 Tax=Raphanus sativus TaxID=3726 RepID=A0A9W3DRL5_RAPSA|nr:L-aspartate oxidase, chloroplastic-like [Raphanus sativus]KAJ4894065.1 hypothetical protein Rs2_20859 [Raphanus sativus]
MITRSRTARNCFVGRIFTLSARSLSPSSISEAVKGRDMAAYVSVENIHDLYLSGQGYKGSSGVTKALKAERCGCHHSRSVSSFNKSLKLRKKPSKQKVAKEQSFSTASKREEESLLG